MTQLLRHSLSLRPRLRQILLQSLTVSLALIQLALHPVKFRFFQLQMYLQLLQLPDQLALSFFQFPDSPLNLLCLFLLIKRSLHLSLNLKTICLKLGQLLHQNIFLLNKCTIRLR